MPFFPPSLKPLPPLRALAYFRSLIPLPGIRDPGQWADDRHRVAFTLARDTQGIVLEKVQDALAELLESGKVGQGPQLIAGLLDACGVSPRESGYADNVFRTNMMDAYQQGAHEQLQEVAEDFPVWRYDGIDDGRERPSHRVHFGRYFASSIPFRQVRDSVKGRFDGFRCRCVATPIHKSEWKRLQERGATVTRFAEIARYAERAVLLGHLSECLAEDAAGHEHGRSGKFVRKGTGFTSQGRHYDSLQDFEQKVQGMTFDRPSDPAFHTPERKEAENRVLDLLRGKAKLSFYPKTQDTGIWVGDDARGSIGMGRHGLEVRRNSDRPIRVPLDGAVDEKILKVLGYAPPNKHAERPPDQRQDTGHNCGVAALQSAIQGLTSQRIAEADLAEQLGTTPEAGTPPPAILRVARRQPGIVTAGRVGLGLDAVRHWCDAGGLVVCPMQMHGDPVTEARLESGHWIVVYEVDAAGDVRFHDPAREGGGARAMPRAEFARRWWDRDGQGKLYVRCGVLMRRKPT